MGLLYKALTDNTKPFSNGLTKPQQTIQRPKQILQVGCMPISSLGTGLVGFGLISSCASVSIAHNRTRIKQIYPNLWPIIAYCLLPTAYRLLPDACCLLPLQQQYVCVNMQIMGVRPSHQTNIYNDDHTYMHLASYHQSVYIASGFPTELDHFYIGRKARKKNSTTLSRISPGPWRKAKISLTKFSF